MSKKGKNKAEKTVADGGDGLTGNFATDFPVHCQQHGLPPVAVRTLPRHGAPPSETSHTSPCVMIDEEFSTKTIHLRNVLLDKKLLAALNSAVEGLQLIAMTLWNVGLGDELTSDLLSLVTNCSVKKLTLDGNSVSPQHAVALFQSPSIEQLSLKCCCLGDAFCAAISSALAENHQLISLDLSSNQITDEGAGHLARALRTNRTLLSLSLAGNRIGDDGAKALSQVLVKFPLTAEEKKHRESLQKVAKAESSICSSGRSSSGAGLERPSQGSRGGAKGKKKEESGKSSAAGRAGSKGKGGKKTAKMEEREEPLQPVGVAGGCGHPLLQLVTEEDGQMWMSGNSSLAHLTLSWNQVGVDGAAALLGAVRAQQTPTVVSPTTTDTVPSDPSVELQPGTGLLRLTLQCNPVPADCHLLEEITEVMKSRDPLVTSSPLAAS